MRAITVRQPWAWAIVHGGKDVENRSRNIAGGYRGPVGIHAGLVLDPIGKNSEIVHIAARRANPDRPVVYRANGRTWVHEPSLHRGAFIGVADLVDAHVSRPAYVDVDGLMHDACCESDWAEQPWFNAPPVVHLVLANVRPLERPIPYPGRLGLWTPPDPIIEQLQEAA